jgi:tRNA nucleotidyltransferase (CCA-adding enzyme)
MDLWDWVKLLRPEEQEKRTLTNHATKIKNILQRNANYYSIREVRFGGSFAKGSMTRGRLEADIVFIVNKKSWHNTIIEQMKETLMINMGCYVNNSCSAEIKKIAITMIIPKPIGDLEFDIIPAKMISSPNSMLTVKNTDFYRGSTTMFQVDYFKKQKENIPYLGDLVRLLKIWRSSTHLPGLSSFMLELIAIEAMCYYDVEETISDKALIACFLIIDRLLKGNPIYPRNWLFTEKNIVAKANKAGLLIVDPGDPSNNVAENISSTEIEKIHEIVNFSIKYAKNGEIVSLFH